MENIPILEILLVVIIFLLYVIAFRLGGIFQKLAEIREETGMFSRQFISRDEDDY